MALQERGTVIKFERDTNKYTVSKDFNSISEFLEYLLDQGYIEGDVKVRDVFDWPGY